MRSLLIAGAGLALAGAGAVDAQQIVDRPGASYGRSGTTMQAPMAQPDRPGPIAARPLVVQTSSRQVDGHRNPRWGSKIGGRWWGGANAPGGWAGYRRPHRGWAVPSYWNVPRFDVGDWSTYGLAQPPYGYRWVRYYDDAVLIDSRGSVFDTASGIDWDRYDANGYVGDDMKASDAIYAAPDDRGYDARHSAGAGYAPPPEPVYARASPGSWVSPDGATTVTTTAGGYRTGSTTVVIQSAPVVTTTTTTEYYDDAVTYRPSTVWKKKRAWRAKPVCHCR